MSIEIKKLDIPEFAAIFCDDIREEVSGKTTIVGAYGTDVLFPEIPALQPKLGVFLRGTIPPIFAGKNLSIKLLKGEEILLEQSEVIPPVQPDATASEQQDGQESRKRRLLDGALMLSPVYFDTPCTLKVMIEIGDFTTCAGKLHVGVAKGKKSNNY